MHDKTTEAAKSRNRAAKNGQAEQGHRQTQQKNTKPFPLSAAPLRLVEKMRHQDPAHPSQHRAPLLDRQGYQRRVVTRAELRTIHRVCHLAMGGARGMTI